MKFLYQDSLLSKQKINESVERLSPYLDHLKEVSQAKGYEFDESSINLPFDESILAQCLEIKEEKVTSNLKYIIDIGIGGSNLGTKAIYDAIFGFKDLLESDRFPKIIFLETVDSEFLRSLQVFLGKIKVPEEILINAISKSGSTTETIGNLEIVLNILSKDYPNILNRVVITTDFESELWNKAQELGVSVLPIPKKVGGRFSVFSAVGLFPLLCSGVNISELLEGARASQGECLQEGINNSALVSAAILYLQNQQGMGISDNFIFHPELEGVGKWYRQLMGESIGKEGKGITPIVSIGSTDLHSMAQLYFGGPKDKITTFLNYPSQNSPSLPQELVFSGLIENITGKVASDIMGAIYEGTKEAYRKNKLPFMEVVLDDLSAKSLGEFLQFKMVEMIFLGKLLEINTFDQPAVEEYKQETQKILQSS